MVMASAAAWWSAIIASTVVSGLLFKGRGQGSGCWYYGEGGRVYGMRHGRNNVARGGVPSCAAEGLMSWRSGFRA